MARSREEALAYQRGYSAGANRRWSEHKPPLPPDDVARGIIEAGQALRDALDGELAKFDEDDVLNQTLGPRIDAFDQAMMRLSEWLKTEAVV